MTASTPPSPQTTAVADNDAGVGVASNGGPSLLRIGLTAGFDSLSRRRAAGDVDDDHDDNDDHDDHDDHDVVAARRGSSTASPYRDGGNREYDDDNITPEICRGLSSASSFCSRFPIVDPAAAAAAAAAASKNNAVAVVVVVVDIFATS